MSTNYDYIDRELEKHPDLKPYYARSLAELKVEQREKIAARRALQDAADDIFPNSLGVCKRLADAPTIRDILFILRDWLRDRAKRIK